MFKIAQRTSAGVEDCWGTLVAVNSFSILVCAQKILMPSDGKHFSCIPTICFLGIHHSQLHCQLSGCWLVCHREEILTDRLHCLKMGRFCFSLKWLFNITFFFTECSTSIYWMILLATDKKAAFSIMNGYLWEENKHTMSAPKQPAHGPRKESARVVKWSNGETQKSSVWTGCEDAHIPQMGVGHCKFQNDEAGHRRRMLRMLGKSKLRIHKTDSTFAWSS